MLSCLLRATFLDSSEFLFNPGPILWPRERAGAAAAEPLVVRSGFLGFAPFCPLSWAVSGVIQLGATHFGTTSPSHASVALVLPGWQRAESFGYVSASFADPAAPALPQNPKSPCFSHKRFLPFLGARGLCCGWEAGRGKPRLRFSPLVLKKPPRPDARTPQRGQNRPRGPKNSLSQLFYPGAALSISNSLFPSCFSCRFP